MEDEELYLKPTKSKKSVRKNEDELFDDYIEFAIDDVLHFIGPSKEKLL